MKRIITLVSIVAAMAASSAGASTRPAPIKVPPTTPPVALDPACVAYAVSHNLPVSICRIPPNPNA